MKTLTMSDLEMINGGGWDPFWKEIGQIAGNWFASHAFTRENRNLHKIGSGSSSSSLAEFLSESNDPLL